MKYGGREGGEGGREGERGIEGGGSSMKERGVINEKGNEREGGRKRREKGNG